MSSPLGISPSRSPAAPRGRRLAFVGLLLAWAAYARPWLAGEVTIPWDAKSQFWPHFHFLARSLATGESPFWMPHLFTGLAHAADPQALLFSPWFLAWARLFPDPDFRLFDLAVLGLPLLGGAGVLLWCTARGLHPLAGMLAAIAFLAGGSAAWRLQHVGQLHSLACLPWLFFLLDRTIERGGWANGLAAGLVAAVLLAGRDQVALLGAYLAVGLVLWRWLQGPERLAALRRSLGPLLLGAVVAAVLVAVPIALTALEAARSIRPSIDLEGAGRGSLHPALLLTLVSPHLFGSGGPMAEFWGPPSFAWPDTGLFVAQNMGVLYAGALPLLLLAAAGPRLLRGPDGPVLATALLLVLAYALGWYTPLFTLAWNILPGVDLYRRPADATFLLGLFLALLAGRALQVALAAGLDRRALRRAFAVAVGGLVGAALLAWARGRLEQAGSALLEAGFWLAAALSGLLAVARMRVERRVLVAAALVVLAAADLVRNHRPNGATGLPVRGEVDWTPLDPKAPEATLDLLARLVAEGRSESRRDRVELVGLGYAWPNAPLVRGLEHTLGHNPVRPARFVAAVGAQDTVAVPDQRRFTPAMPSWSGPLAALLGLRWIATPVPIEELAPGEPGARLRPVARTEAAFVYERLDALPRVVLATSWEPLDAAAVLERGEWPAVDLATTALLEQPPVPAPRPGARPGRARLVRYGQGEVVVEAEAPDGGILILHDAWHPWWRAERDGMPVPVLRAQLLFRAVALPPGRHGVRFTFRPFRGALEELAIRG